MSINLLLSFYYHPALFVAAESVSAPKSTRRQLHDKSSDIMTLTERSGAAAKLSSEITASSRRPSAAGANFTATSQMSRGLRGVNAASELTRSALSDELSDDRELEIEQQKFISQLLDNKSRRQHASRPTATQSSWYDQLMSVYWLLKGDRKLAIRLWHVGCDLSLLDVTHFSYPEQFVSIGTIIIDVMLCHTVCTNGCEYLCLLCIGL